MILNTKKPLTKRKVAVCPPGIVIGPSNPALDFASSKLTLTAYKCYFNKQLKSHLKTVTLAGDIWEVVAG